MKHNHLPKWLRKDVAAEIIADLISHKSKELEILKASGNPIDFTLLTMEIENLLEERKEMYFGNTEIIQKILVEYAPMVKERLTKGDHS